MMECGLGPGGWIWKNYLDGFSSSGDRDGDGNIDPEYFLWELNISGFFIPDGGRWALDPHMVRYQTPLSTSIMIL